MSRTIDATYTLDPSAGNDPSVNYKVAATDSVSPVALNMDQIANAVAVRIGSAPPPNPTEDLNQLVVTIQNNTLTANIQAVTGVTYTHYAVLLDDDTEPTYPTDYTSGTIPSIQSVAADPANPVSSDWGVTTTIYVWVYDLLTTTAKELLTTGAVSGIEVTTVDTLGPVWLSGTAGFSIDNNGAYTIVAPTDAGIGLATTATYDIYVDDIIHISNSTALTGSVSVASGQHDAYAVARDKSGNTGLSDEDSFTIATQTAGTVSLPTTTQEVTEGNSLVIPVTRSGGTAAYAITLSTRGSDDCPMTSTPTTNYTGQSGTTLNFGIGDNSEDFTLVTVDNNETTNKVLNLEIDFDNTDVQNGTVEVGTESCLVKIIGTGLTAFAGFQMTTTTPFYASFQCENAIATYGGTLRNSIKSGQTSDQWEINSTFSTDRYADGTRLTANSVANTYGSATVLDSEAPYAQYPIHFTSEAISGNDGANNDLFDIFVRLSHSPSGTGGNVHFSLVNPIVSITEAGGTATITMTYNVADSAGGSIAGQTVWLEDVTGTNAAEYNAVAGLTVATHTGGTAVFTVTGMSSGNPDAGTGNVLGCDEDALNAHSRTDTTDWAWLWQNEDEASNQLCVYVDTASTRELRMYVQDISSDLDVITIAPRKMSWGLTDVNVNENGVAGDALDDDMGHTQSNYSGASSGTPSDNSENPEFPYLPLPTATTPSLSC